MGDIGPGHPRRVGRGAVTLGCDAGVGPYRSGGWANRPYRIGGMDPFRSAR